MRFYSILISLIILSFLATACSQSEPETTVYENVKGYTFADGEITNFSSIAFREGKVLKTANEGTLAGEYAGARVLDGEGNVMLPGLIDAHGHVMGLGFQELDVDVAGAGSLDSTLQMVSNYASEYSDREWILGRGWNHTRWDINRFPTAEELDGAVEDRPVWLSRVDGHAGWANTKAMEAAGITAETEDPQGGKIIRDENGNPTGVFIDAAMNLVESEVPARTDQEREMFLALKEKLQAPEVADMEQKELQSLIFNIAQSRDVQPRAFFGAIYQVLLGQEQGPRFGSFAKLVGVSRVIELIEQRVG